MTYGPSASYEGRECERDDWKGNPVEREIDEGEREGVWEYEWRGSSEKNDDARETLER